MPSKTPSSMKRRHAKVGRVRRKGASLHLLHTTHETSSERAVMEEARSLVDGFGIDLAGFTLVGWNHRGSTFTALNWTPSSPFQPDRIALVSAALIQERIDED